MTDLSRNREKGLKVLYITHYSSLYGANLSLLNMTSILNNDYGVEPYVLAPSTGDLPQKLGSEDFSYLIEKWYGWAHQVGELWKPLVKKTLNLIKFPYIKYLVKEKFPPFDLIHTNSSVTQLGGYLSKELNIPHIWHLREFGREDYDLVHDGGLEKASHFFEDNSVKLIANSKAVKEKYSQFITPELIEVVYNGVKFEKNKVDRDFSKIKNKEVIKFLFVGLIQENKNQLEALKAAKILKENLGLANFKLLFAGDGKESYLRQLKKFARENDLEDNVEFLGYVHDIQKWRKKTDVSLVCSKKEAFGRVTVEAMMAQMPVIASNTGGTPEIVEDGETGILYQLGDCRGLAEAMKKLIEDRNLIELMSKNGYDKASRKFTAKHNARKIFEIYSSIL